MDELVESKPNLKSIINSKFDVIEIIGHSLSIIGLFLLIILYFILYYKAKCKEIKTNLNLVSNETQSNKNKQLLENDNSNTANQSKKKTIQYKKGIGNDLLLGFSFFQLIFSVSVLINVKKSDEWQLCYMQAFFSNLGELSATAWVACITHSFLKSLTTLNIVESEVNKLYWYYITYTVLFPLLISFLPIFTKSYGMCGNWCWLNPEENASKPLFVIITIFYIGNFIFLILSTYQIHNYFTSRYYEIKDDSEKSKEKKIINQYRILVLLIPFIVCFSKIPVFLNRTYEIFSKTKNYLVDIHSISSSFEGFLYSIIYFFYYRQIWPVIFCYENSSKYIEKETNLSYYKYNTIVREESNNNLSSYPRSNLSNMISSDSSYDDSFQINSLNKNDILVIDHHNNPFNNDSNKIYETYDTRLRHIHYESEENILENNNSVNSN